VNPFKDILRDPSDALYNDTVEIYRINRKPIPDQHITFKHKSPTFSLVINNLWMGGAPPPQANVGGYFDCLVFCAREYQIPECFPDVQVAQARLNDDGSRFKKQEAEEAVIAASKVIKWLEKGLKVLVTCFAGRNRSGLVTAIALCKGPSQMGLDDAVRLIRNARGPNALSNPDFMAFLMKYCD